MPKYQRAIQYCIIMIVNVAAAIGMALKSPEFVIQSIPAAVGVCLVFGVVHVVYWWLFINFAWHLPVWLYPLLTLFLSGSIFMFLGNLVPGVAIASLRTSVEIVVWLTLIRGAHRGAICFRGKRLKASLPPAPCLPERSEAPQRILYTWSALLLSGTWAPGLSPAFSKNEDKPCGKPFARTAIGPTPEISGTHLCAPPLDLCCRRSLPWQ